MKKRDFLKGVLGIAGAAVLPGTIDKAIGSETIKPYDMPIVDPPAGKEFLTKETVEKAYWSSPVNDKILVWDGTNWIEAKIFDA